MQDTLTVKQAADLCGLAPITVRVRCARGLVPGAYRLNPRIWLIPNTPESIVSLKKQRPGRK